MRFKILSKGVRGYESKDEREKKERERERDMCTKGHVYNVLASGVIGVEIDASCGCGCRTGPSLLTQLHQLADLESQLKREEKILEEIMKEVKSIKLEQGE